MILKRPYAFLIKHFKIIHTILLFLSTFLLYKIYTIIKFFGSYIRYGGISEEVSFLQSKYTSSSVFIIPILIILICGIIIYLLRYKDKPILLYIIIVLFNIILIILFYFLSSFLYDLQFSTPGIRLINIIRDVFRFVLVLDFIEIALFFIRSIGFDVKKFDFKKDLLDLGVEEKDNEEYEFEFKFDKDVFKSKVNKKVRYFKYFYKENKYFFVIIGGVVIFVSTLLIVKIINSAEKIYKENQYFETQSLKMKVLESYKTDKTSLGSNISTKNFFVIVKMEFTNKLSNDLTIYTNNIKLNYDEYELSTPVFDLDSNLMEFPTIYYKEILKSHETKTLNLLYEVPYNYLKTDFFINYLYSIEYNKKGESEYEYKKVKLNPMEFSDEKSIVETATLGNELNFNGSLLGNTKIKIYNTEIGELFHYTLVKCDTTNCISSKKSVTNKSISNFDMTLMRIDYDIDYDKSIFGDNYNNSSFISKFATIRFEINGKEYNNRLELVDMTPYPAKNNIIVQVRSKVKNADKIYMDFNIRDKIYTYIIRDNTIKEGE